MTVRVRYRPNELSEAGVVENITEANGYTVMEDNTLILEDYVYADETDTKTKVRRVGIVHADRWESAVIVREEE